MRKILFSWATFWLVVAGIIIYLLLPLRQKLRFGIDLVGGTFLTLKVQTDKAVEAKLQGILQFIPDKLKSGNYKLPVSKQVKGQEILLKFADVPSANAASIYLKDNLKDLITRVNGDVITMSFTPREAQKIKTDAVRTNIDVFHTRLNRLSVEEITVAQKGEDQIIVELPDIADPQRARAMIGKPAVLEFKLVEKKGKSPEDILYEYDGIMPEGKEILPHRDRDEKGKPIGYFLVPKFTDITGSLLRDASVGFGGETGNQLAVKFKFSAEGGDKFYELTSRNHGRNLAIVLDNEIISAPSIGASISTEGEIFGRFTGEEVKELAMLLKSGALVAPVTIEEDRQIGATLGAESIRKGLLSCLVGLGLLLFFSILYYRVSGFLAFVALLFNLVLVLFGLASVRATLTLPGIAGMILTIGMAIDASILIYERIKESLRQGVSIRKSVNTGFANAMVVILDANITTFIVGVVLYKFGTGPIRGFAVTMMLGIVATLITGLFFLRSLFNFILNAFNVKKLSI